MKLDPRIGVLNSGVYYAYAHGYNREPVMGTREDVEIALGLRERNQEINSLATAKTRSATWDVLLKFQHPAWDEVDGVEYRGIPAGNKSEAIKYARKQAENDGHAVSGRGMYWFTATKSKE